MSIKKTALILILLISFSACKSSKNKRVVTKKVRTTKTVANKTTSKTSANVKSIVDYAKTFEGVKYKYGGTTKKGMDCSGLIYTSFKKEAISLPRTTNDLSKTGNWIDLKEVKVGDLLFFATKKNSRKVNHVGIVTTSRTGYVEFIHASTSRGVMISNLAERYWYLAYVQARRVM
ncbi:C40 family peptidase [Lacinutrix sp. C3R15]|uniref:C40 family peptidase n=1 Tax=Flavobacteriaceae TaxID=49546 RepID=UPI001C09AFDC|nr:MULTISPECIES: C40 family peptidase [Flavobacteriaceae]MBU2939218.1 C40 family peptidase [Lacinutrix sp. C3R15]MDO6622533.1 C40 family peptidase [Oceanihabitans sp. 1_MG-2023]